MLDGIKLRDLLSSIVKRYLSYNFLVPRVLEIGSIIFIRVIKCSLLLYSLAFI